jgi:hypothetical protein
LPEQQQQCSSQTNERTKASKQNALIEKKYNHKIFTIYFKYVYLRKDFKKPATATEGLVQ